MTVLTGYTAGGLLGGRVGGHVELYVDLDAKGIDESECVCPSVITHWPAPFGHGHRGSRSRTGGQGSDVEHTQLEMCPK